jgi:hypothetical protein
MKREFMVQSARRLWSRYKALTPEQKDAFVARFLGSFHSKPHPNTHHTMEAVKEALQWAELANKSIKEMTTDEIYAFDGASDVSIGITPKKLNGYTGWRIADFFFAAAERKGAKKLSELVRGPNVEFDAVRTKGSDYKVQWKFPDGGTFTIFSDGHWSYDREGTFLDGKLQCPHADAWVDKMVKKGTPDGVARSDWGDYYLLRHR